MIYFMQAVDGGPIKIGCSVDVERRQKELETYYDRKLALIAIQEGGPAEEVEMHARFSHLRIGRTEQFRPAPELMEYIGKPSLVSANPDAVEAMPGVRMVCVVNLKGSQEFADWLDGLHQETGIPKMEIVRRALALWAKQGKHSQPPKI